MSDVDALRAGDPTTIGRFSLIGRLGEGGQGIVFLGEDDTGRRAAVKVLHSRPDDISQLGRFVKEIQTTQRVEAFCTAEVIEVDFNGTPPYVASEFIPGPSLHRLVTEQGPRVGSALHRLAVATATALAAIHEAGVVHRDFKPSNVMMGPDGARVIDFGIARAVDAAGTLTGHVVGTPAYMAPEQIGGAPAAAPMDVFAWGCVIVFAATGRSPFGQDSVMQVIRRIIHEPPDLGDLAEPLRGIVADCLAKDPAARPSAQDVLLRLLGRRTPSAPGGPAILAPTPSWQPGTPSPYPPPTIAMPQGRSRRSAVVYGVPAGVVLAAAAVAVPLVLTTQQGGHTPKPTPTPTASSSAPLASVFPADMAGTWSGTVSESPGGKSSVRVTITAGATSATADYGDYKCASRLQISNAWAAQAVPNPTTVNLVEGVTKGDCPNGSNAQLVLQSPTQMWFSLTGYKTDASQTVFTRVGVITKTG
ncbi:serine/threonine-protein kinase [Actinoallomurus sp. NPDC050550]|uniref:serine/threonine protein kinase n=1 Tax=Actinoallomurus sp. NPDC050550 TaxID=3154937 RepID=UPI0033CC12BC